MLDVLLPGVAGALLGAAFMAIVWQRDRGRLLRDAMRLEVEREATARAAEAQRAALADNQQQLRDAFAALAHAALADNRRDFLTNAESLFQPVRESLTRVQERLADVDKAREGSFRSVATSLQSLAAAEEQLRATTQQLAEALRSPNVRGKWGEIQLKRIVELAGMLAQCDFSEKPSTTTTEGLRQTPDLVIRLPGGANVVVDAKVPIDAYLAATNATSEDVRARQLAAHARQVRDHVRALGSKEYWRQFDPAPELVVMFLPLEPLLSVAFEQDGGLLEEAARLHVIPATPMTLLALLKAVAYGWQQQAVADNAREIQALGRDLYERLATMTAHIEGVGRNLHEAASSYNHAISSLEQRVLPAARRFKDLGVGAGKTLDTLEPINPELRPIVKPELYGIADDDPPRSAPGERLVADAADATEDDGERRLAATSTRPSD
jgi:DNA recombination protein RmuC